MIRHFTSWTMLLGALCAGCASQGVPSGAQHDIALGSIGRSDAASTFHVSGTVDPAIEPTLFVEYVASRDASECTRLDGESGRVVRTKWLRYPVKAQDGRFEIDILLDPLDTIGCAFVPRTVYGAARNVRNGRATNAYIPWVAFPSAPERGRAQLAEQTINCQNNAAQSQLLDCSLPREHFTDGRKCATERVLLCIDGCSAIFHVVFVDPPRAAALWALPAGCPGPT